MNISKVSTTVRDELNIMDMDKMEQDWAWERYRDDSEYDCFGREYFKEYLETIEMKGKGFILNPYYDADESYRVWKYDLEVKDWFVHHKYIKPEELAEYNAKEEVIRFGHTLCDRLMTDEERIEFDRLMWAGEVA